MNLKSAAGIAAVSLLLAACTTVPLTPERSAALNEAQRFADEVTKVYGGRPVKIRAYEGRQVPPQLTWGGYVMMSATDLDRGNARESIVLPVAAATLDYVPDSPTAAPYRRQWAFDLNRRAVEISVKFLGLTTPHAVEVQAARLVAHNEDLRRKNFFDFRGEVSPCEQVRDLWSHFAMTDPIPTCNTGPITK